jgi:hypothetical protein
MNFRLPDDIDLESIADPDARAQFHGLLSLVKRLTAENQVVRAENQRLWEEISWLRDDREPTLVLGQKTVAARWAQALSGGRVTAVPDLVQGQDVRSDRD